MGNGHAALRKGRASVPGQIYLVTFVTASRRPHFSAWAVAAQAASLLSSRAAWPDANLLAWVLMPDHWHGLVQLNGAADLANCVGRCKGRAAKRLHEQHPGLGQIWARGFHDRALRRQDDLHAAARYVLMNPLRAGLARRMGDYPYWDAGWL